MTQREQRLAVVVAVLIGGYGLWWASGQWSEALGRRRGDLDAARIALLDAKLRNAEATDALERLVALQDRSLPGDPEIAQSRYRAWLVEALGDAGLAFDNVRRISPPRGRGDAYLSMAFVVQADGELTDVTRFLHQFYRSPATHKLTQLKLTPLGTAGRLRVTANIEALIVNGASSQTELPTGESSRLAGDSLQYYLASISERDVFAEHRPPPPPPAAKPEPVARKAPPPPPPFDHAAHAQLTGVVGSGEGRQAWVLVKTTGEPLRLSAGDTLKVGQLDARVVEVGDRHLIYQTDGQRYRVSLGEHLREGAPLPTDELL